MRAKRQRGSVTVEAVIMIAIFLPAMISLMSLALFTFTQLRVQQALNQTAREISQYYYLLAVSGFDGTPQENAELDEVLANLSIFTDSVADGEAKAEKLVDSASNVGDVTGFEDLNSKLGDLEQQAKDMGSSVEAIQASGQALANSMKDVAANPAAVLKCLAKTVGETALKHAVAAPLSKAIFNNYIRAGSTESVDVILERMGIEGDMNFWGSTLVEDGKSINVVVTYTIKGIFNDLFPTDYTVTQVASTVAWNQVSLKDINLEKKEEPNKEEPSENPDGENNPEKEPAEDEDKKNRSSFWELDESLQEKMLSDYYRSLYGNDPVTEAALIKHDNGLNLNTFDFYYPDAEMFGKVFVLDPKPEDMAKGEEYWENELEHFELLMNYYAAQLDINNIEMQDGSSYAMQGKNEIDPDANAMYKYQITIVVPADVDIEEFQKYAEQMDTTTEFIFVKKE